MLLMLRAHDPKEDHSWRRAGVLSMIRDYSKHEAYRVLHYIVINVVHLNSALPQNCFLGSVSTISAPSEDALNNECCSHKTGE